VTLSVKFGRILSGHVSCLFYETGGNLNQWYATAGSWSHLGLVWDRQCVLFLGSDIL